MGGKYVPYDIEPYVGVGLIAFGAPRERVRKILQSPVEESAKTDTGVPTDFFTEAGIFVYYKQQGLVEAVEFGGPASPTFRGQELLGHPYDDLEKWVMSLDPNTSRNNAGLTSYGLGLGLYAPSAMKEPHLPVVGVIAFERGYYDRRGLHIG